MTEVNQRIAVGAAWMVLFKLVDRSVGLISTIVLARLLVPSDFGLVALAAALIGAAELLGAFSFDVTLIHRVDTTRSHFDTAWSLNILFGAACAILLALAAVPAASFYGDPRLAWIRRDPTLQQPSEDRRTRRSR